MTAYEAPLTNFNVYIYANNNPYGFTDPDGRYSCNSTSMCSAMKGFIARLKQARSSRDISAKERARLSQTLRYIGTEGDKQGPTYTEGSFKDEGKAAHTDGHGNVVVDLSHISTDVMGATDIAHEADHDLSVSDLKHDPKNEGEVRTLEESAYKTGEAVMRAFGQFVTPAEHQRDVDGSVQLWKDEQEKKKQEAQASTTSQ